MKGALSVFGAELARSIAEEIEAVGLAGQLEDARALYDRLEAEVVATERALDRFVRELD
jgi:ATP-dependent protease HslVU (ClpYQ) peptidase subunit